MINWSNILPVSLYFSTKDILFYVFALLLRVLFYPVEDAYSVSPLYIVLWVDSRSNCVDLIKSFSDIFVTVASVPIISGKEVSVDLLNSTIESPMDRDVEILSRNLAKAGSGALIGGVFGTFVAPGLGTAVGATIGSFMAPLISHCISLIIK